MISCPCGSTRRMDKIVVVDEKRERRTVRCQRCNRNLGSWLRNRKKRRV